MRKSPLLWSVIALALMSDARSTDIKEDFKKEVKSTHSSFSTGIDFDEKDQLNLYKEAVSNLHIESKTGVGFSGLKGLALSNYEPAILTLASLYKLGELIDQDLEKSITLYEKLPKNPDALISLGSIYHTLGQLDEAQKYYGQARDLNHPFAERCLEELEADRL